MKSKPFTFRLSAFPITLVLLVFLSAGCFKLPKIRHFKVSPETICDCNDVQVEWEVADANQVDLVIQDENGNNTEQELEPHTGSKSIEICGKGSSVAAWLVCHGDKEINGPKTVISVLKNEGVNLRTVTFTHSCPGNSPSPEYPIVTYTEDHYAPGIAVTGIINTHSDRNVRVTHLSESGTVTSFLLEPEEHRSGLGLSILGAWEVSETDNLKLNHDIEWEGCPWEVSGRLTRLTPPDIKLKFELRCP